MPPCSVLGCLKLVLIHALKSRFGHSVGVFLCFFFASSRCLHSTSLLLVLLLFVLLAIYPAQFHNSFNMISTACLIPVLSLMVSFGTRHPSRIPNIDLFILRCVTCVFSTDFLFRLSVSTTSVETCSIH